jgi:hypothetical protein
MSWRIHGSLNIQAKDGQVLRRLPDAPIKMTFQYLRMLTKLIPALIMTSSVSIHRFDTSAELHSMLPSDGLAVPEHHCSSLSLTALIPA